MTKEEIFNYFYTNSANLGIKNILFTLLAGVFISMILYLTYLFCYRGVAYNKKFNNTLVAILLIAAVIMLMISSNVVISLGMVGALSIIRFRTAIKDARDTVFIFWAIAEGLCVGSQNVKLALITSLFIAVVMFITSGIPSFGKKYFVIITGKDIDEIGLNIKWKELKMKATTRSASKSATKDEYIFEVRSKKDINFEEFKAIKGVETLHWIIESDEMIG